MNSKLVALLRDARIARNLKQSDVADHIGIKSNTLSNWETGRTEPDMDTFLSLCDIYGINPADALSAAYGSTTPSANFFSASEISLVSAYRDAIDDDKDAVNAILRKYMVTTVLKGDSEKMA